MSQLSQQLKMLRAVREILMGDGRNALPRGNEPKPDFCPRPESEPLPRSTPEAEGFSSAGLDALCRRMAALPNANLHSLIVARHGKVVAEGYFAPYQKGLWHVTHSLCKTITGTAVGMAISEGLFGLDDCIVDLFPKEAGLFPSRQMRAVKVHHLLTMTSGITYNEVSEALETDWVKGIFSSPIAFDPGSKFAYNSMNSYLLSALVCRKSGKTLVEYLAPRLLTPMGFGPFAWEKSCEGYEKGGWGLYMMPEDMAKLGQLYLQKGRWDTPEGSRQLVPAEWVEQAVHCHTQSDGTLGYGHHCWVDVENGLFVMNGMFGQYVVAAPQLDMVVVMTAGNTRVFADSPAYDLTTEYLRGLGDAPQSLPPAPAPLARLEQTLAALAFRTPFEPPEPALQKLQPRSRARRWRTAQRLLAPAVPAGVDAFCHTTWQFKENHMGLLPLVVQAMDNNFASGLAALHLERKGGELTLLWEEGDGTIVLPVGLGAWQQRDILVGQESFHTASRARLLADEDGRDVLNIDVCFLENSSYRIIKLVRQGRDILLKLDEQPQFQSAIEGAIHQTQTNQSGKGQGNALSGALADNDYLDYRLVQLCTPSLVGTPVPKPGP